MQLGFPETMLTSLISHTPELKRSIPKIVSLTIKLLGLWAEEKGGRGIINSSGLGNYLSNRV